MKIDQISLKQLSSSIHTKDRLISFLGRKLLVHFVNDVRPIVVAYRKEVHSNHGDYSHLSSCQEEADTKIILHAVDLAKRGLERIHISSPDTDVFVLAIRRCPMLPAKTYFVTGKGQQK